MGNSLDFLSSILLSNWSVVLICQAVRKIHLQLQAAREAAIEQTLPKQTAKLPRPHATSLDSDLQEAALVRPSNFLMTAIHKSLMQTENPRLGCLG